MVKHIQTIRRQQSTNCFNVFDHSVELAFEGLTNLIKKLSFFSLSGRVRGQGRSNMALYSPAKTNDSVDTSKVGTILKNYGYNVDEEMFGRKSETSRLLVSY